MNANSLPALDRRGVQLLRSFVQELHLSASVYAKIVILARRIADRCNAPSVQTVHLLDAIQFCTLQESDDAA